MGMQVDGNHDYFRTEYAERVKENRPLEGRIRKKRRIQREKALVSCPRNRMNTSAAKDLGKSPRDCTG